MIDLQAFIDRFNSMACVLSIEKTGDGKKGAIRIEAANDEYVQAMEKRDENGKHIFTKKFVPGERYESYMKKMLNFENFVYECAIQKKPVHAYIRQEHFDFCINLLMLPLDIDDPKKAYCSFTNEISQEVDPDEMSRLSAETSANVLKTCIKLRKATNLQQTMDEVINDIREICSASYCCVLLTDFNEHTCSVFSDSIKKGSDQLSIREIVSEDFLEHAKIWLDILAGSNCLMIRDKKDMDFIRKQHPTWHSSLANANVHSLVLLPLEYNNSVIGFIWVANFNTDNTLQIKETLEITTFFVASEIANYQLVERLEMLSHKDLLTGVQNRNSMNNRISEFIDGKVPHKSLALIFADVNGLKPINDNQGHDAGDRLLKDASRILKETFEDGEIYRAGGDEFLVIVLDHPKEDLKAKVVKLREESKKPNNVSFSLGFYYDDQGGDIRNAMHEADVRMYEDKKEFYAHFPANRKRL